MKMQTVILFILLYSAAARAGKAPADEGVPAEKRIDITGVAISGDDEGEVTVAFEVVVGGKAARGNRTITVTPVLISGGERLELRPLTVRGRAARISQERRARAAGIPGAGKGAILLKNGETYSYVASLPEFAFEPGAELVFESCVGVCRSEQRGSLPVAENFVEEHIEVYY